MRGFADGQKKDREKDAEDKDPRHKEKRKTKEGVYGYSEGWKRERRRRQGEMETYA